MAILFGYEHATVRLCTDMTRPDLTIQFGELILQELYTGFW
jgi:hypothetical protein